MGEHTRTLRTAAEGSLASLMGMIQVSLKYGADTHLSQVDAWIAAATRLQHEALGGDDATMLSRWRRAELVT